jgi:hypothetical protein
MFNFILTNQVKLQTSFCKWSEINKDEGQSNKENGELVLEKMRVFEHQKELIISIRLFSLHLPSR